MNSDNQTTEQPLIPRDRWITGKWVSGMGDKPYDDPEHTHERREYIVHLHSPRFAARVVNKEYGQIEAYEAPCDVTTPSVFEGDGIVICEVIWFDKPMPDQIMPLLKEVAEAANA